MFHYEMSSRFGTFKWMTNTTKVWMYSSDLKEYIEQDAEPWPAQIGPGPGLPGIDWQYVSKFRAVGGMAAWTKFLKDDISPDDICDGPTALIELSMGDKEEPVPERLRVYTKNGLVCQSTLPRHRRSLRGPASDDTTVTRWIYRQLSGPIDPAFFRFDPPKGAKRVKRFRAPSTPMSDW